MSGNGLSFVLTMFAAAEPAGSSSVAKQYFIEVCYLAASALFILGLRGLTAPE